MALSAPDTQGTFATFSLYRQVDLLYRNLLLGQVVTLLNAAFLVWIAFDSVSALSLGIWLSLVAVIAVLRMSWSIRYHRNTPLQRQTAVVYWHQFAIMGASAGGLVWMAGALLLMTAGDATLQFFTAFVMAGMVAGAVPVLAAEPRAFRIYAWPIVLAVAIGAIDLDHVHIAFTLMSLLFLVVVTRSADYYHQTLQESIRLEHDKGVLAGKLENARALAEQSSRVKGDFLANVSHEIRTPMNGILGMTDLALVASSEDERLEYMHIIRTSASSLLTIINDILDFSKIDAGKLSVEHIRFELLQIVTDSINILAASAREKNLTIRYTLDAALPGSVVGDPVRVRQVLINLLGNAVKFTAHGEIQLDVVVQTSSAMNATVHFSVRDSGIGIPADKLNHIFEAFTQADTSTTRKYGGTGLGLSISRQLVEIMGGSMWVESVLGSGSTFHFVIPFGLVAEQFPPVSEGQTAEVGGLPADTVSPLAPAVGSMVAPTFDYATAVAAMDGEILSIITPAFLACYQQELDGLRQAVTDGQLDEAVRHAYGIKSTLASFGSHPAEWRATEIATLIKAENFEHQNFEHLDNLLAGLAKEVEKLVTALRARP